MTHPLEETTEHKGSSSPVTGRCALANAIVLVLFLTVPLAVAPGFWDEFTSIKWYALEGLAVAWFLVELWPCGSRGWPTFVRDRWPVAFLLSLLVLASSLRNGVAWALPALLDRTSFILLALASFWYFRRNPGRTGYILVATEAATGLVVAVGMAQVLGWDPLSYLSAGDHRSSFFGNVNMTAQFLGFAVVLLMTGEEGLAESRVAGALRETLLVVTSVYLYFLSCRSVFVALGVAVAVMLLVGRLTPRSLARMLGLTALLVLLLVRFGSVLGPRSISTQARGLRATTDKATSTAMRLAVWRGTLHLIRDHPGGVGSGNFGEEFIPYQLGQSEISTDALFFRTPHNEYLRTLAADGVVFGVILAGFLLSLLRKLMSVARVPPECSGGRSLLAAGVAFFAVEAFFQFPFGTAFGCLMAAVLFGLALASLESPALSSPTRANAHKVRAIWCVVGTIVAAVVAVVLARSVASEWLFVNRNRDAQAQATACRLNPRNLPACVTAAWLQAVGGDRRKARTGLVRVLRNAPYYHPAIRLLAEVAASDGDRPGACLYLWTYDQLFRGRSSLHSRLGALCGDKIPVGAPSHGEMPYYGTMPLAERDAVGE